MEIPELAGPFKLTDSNISINVRRGVTGAYVMGPLHADGRLTVKLTGRSEADLAADLRRHIAKYDAFGFIRAESAADALDLECRLYHHFEPADNSVHPGLPTQAGWQCPVCDFSSQSKIESG